MLRDKVEIRLALDSAGPLIAELLKENDVELPDCDWSKVYPNWLIATVEEEVIGCCMVMVGRPIGFVEMFFVKPSAPFKFRAIAVRKLCIQAMNTLYHAGCQYVGGYLHMDNRKFGDVLQKMRFQHLAKAELYLKRLA